uniref:Ig-like domain-containing protein n=1 Tax=Scleropages formosus TaxID=113540 RepID=A0A8C9VBE7_SCLFO
KVLSAGEMDITAALQIIRKKSKVPGVIVTQFVEELPEGKSTPDFIRKPITLTIQEGKFAFFKAVVTGDPKPQVTWTRAKREMLDLEKFQNKYNSITGEYILEIHKVCGEDADTYKCFAVNEFGKAVCTATLNVIEVGFRRCKTMGKEDGALSNSGNILPHTPSRSRAVCEKPEKKQAGVDDKFWEVLLSAEKKDYERICAEHGVTDFRWMLRKLGEMRRHREEEQSKVLGLNLRQIEVKGDGTASFEFALVLKDPTKIVQDDVMIPYSEDMDMKHNLEQVDKNLVFTIDDLRPEDVGLYQADAEEVNVFSTEFKILPVDFVIRIQEVKAKEGEDAVFQCVLSHPLPKVIWMGKNTILENGEKYRITVSQDNLTHQLVVKNCLSLDKGIYSVVAGIKTCSAWLLVEAGIDPSMYGKKKVRKTTQAGSRGARSLCSVPTFLVPLKDHVAQPGYECRMSCAVGGHPAPRVTWQHGDVSLHGDADYYISNTCGVCSMAILRVGPGDAGMYTVTAENAAGRAECSARLTVKGNGGAVLGAFGMYRQAFDECC